jgi:ribosomal protein S18 acetylase RimI-like enzyme
MITIRRSKPKNFLVIKNSVIAVENASFEKDVRFVYEDKDFDNFELETGLCYIILDGKKIIGYIMAGPVENDSRYKKSKYWNTKTVHLDSIAIHPKYQGKGIGVKAMNKLLSDSKKRGFKRIILDATSSGMYKLALKYDFSVVRHYKKWEGNRENYFMEKVL